MQRERATTNDRRSSNRKPTPGKGVDPEKQGIADSTAGEVLQPRPSVRQRPQNPDDAVAAALQADRGLTTINGNSSSSSGGKEGRVSQAAGRRTAASPSGRPPLGKPAKAGTPAQPHDTEWRHEDGSSENEEEEEGSGSEYSSSYASTYDSSYGRSNTPVFFTFLDAGNFSSLLPAPQSHSPSTSSLRQQSPATRSRRCSARAAAMGGPRGSGSSLAVRSAPLVPAEDAASATATQVSWGNSTRRVGSELSVWTGAHVIRGGPAPIGLRAHDSDSTISPRGASSRLLSLSLQDRSGGGAGLLSPIPSAPGNNTAAKAGTTRHLVLTPPNALEPPASPQPTATRAPAPSAVAAADATADHGPSATSASPITAPLRESAPPTSALTRENLDQLRHLSTRKPHPLSPPNAATAAAKRQRQRKKSSEGEHSGGDAGSNQGGTHSVNNNNCASTNEQGTDTGRATGTRTSVDEWRGAVLVAAAAAAASQKRDTKEDGEPAVAKGPSGEEKKKNSTNESAPPAETQEKAKEKTGTGTADPSSLQRKQRPAPLRGAPAKPLQPARKVPVFAAAAVRKRAAPPPLTTRATLASAPTRSQPPPRPLALQPPPPQPQRSVPATAGENGKPSSSSPTNRFLLGAQRKPLRPPPPPIKGEDEPPPRDEAASASGEGARNREVAERKSTPTPAPAIPILASSSPVKEVAARRKDAPRPSVVVAEGQEEGANSSSGGKGTGDSSSPTRMARTTVAKASRDSGPSKLRTRPPSAVSSAASSLGATETTAGAEAARRHARLSSADSDRTTETGGSSRPASGVTTQKPLLGGGCSSPVRAANSDCSVDGPVAGTRSSSSDVAVTGASTNTLPPSRAAQQRGGRGGVREPGGTDSHRVVTSTTTTTLTSSNGEPHSYTPSDSVRTRHSPVQHRSTVAHVRTASTASAIDSVRRDESEIEVGVANNHRRTSEGEGDRLVVAWKPIAAKRIVAAKDAQAKGEDSSGGDPTGSGQDGGGDRLEDDNHHSHQRPEAAAPRPRGKRNLALACNRPGQDMRSVDMPANRSINESVSSVLDAEPASDLRATLPPGTSFHAAKTQAERAEDAGEGTQATASSRHPSSEQQRGHPGASPAPVPGQRSRRLPPKRPSGDAEDGTAPAQPRSPGRGHRSLSPSRAAALQRREDEASLLSSQVLYPAPGEDAAHHRRRRQDRVRRRVPDNFPTDDFAAYQRAYLPSEIVGAAPIPSADERKGDDAARALLPPSAPSRHAATNGRGTEAKPSTAAATAMMSPQSQPHPPPPPQQQQRAPPLLPSLARRQSTDETANSNDPTPVMVSIPGSDAVRAGAEDAERRRAPTLPERGHLHEPARNGSVDGTATLATKTARDGAMNEVRVGTQGHWQESNSANSDHSPPSANRPDRRQSVLSQHTNATRLHRGSTSRDAEHPNEVGVRTETAGDNEGTYRRGSMRVQRYLRPITTHEAGECEGDTTDTQKARRASAPDGLAKATSASDRQRTRAVAAATAARDAPNDLASIIRPLFPQQPTSKLGFSEASETRPRAAAQESTNDDAIVGSGEGDGDNAPSLVVLHPYSRSGSSQAAAATAPGIVDEGEAVGSAEHTNRASVRAVPLSTANRQEKPAAAADRQPLGPPTLPALQPRK